VATGCVTEGGRKIVSRGGHTTGKEARFRGGRNGAPRSKKGSGRDETKKINQQESPDTRRGGRVGKKKR